MGERVKSEAESQTKHAVIDTALGDVTLVATESALVGLYFPEHWHAPDASALGARVPASHHPLLAQAHTQLNEYLAGTRRAFDLPMVTDGDEFSERTWQLLQEIPYGTTTSYGALAERLGDRRLAQRVGQAVGRNPLCVFIPCHRVLGADGSLTGYAGGLERKRQLLELEEPVEVHAARLF